LDLKRVFPNKEQISHVRVNTQPDLLALTRRKRLQTPHPGRGFRRAGKKTPELGCSDLVRGFTEHPFPRNSKVAP
jgi:hypothetical protein